MSSNGNRTLLIVVVVIGLLSMIVAALVGLGAAMFLGTSEQSTTPPPQAVSVGIEPEPVAPGAGVEPTFDPVAHDALVEEIGEEHDEPLDALSPERYREMSVADIVAAMSFNRLINASQWDERVAIERPFKMRAPQETAAPLINVDQAVYSGVGALTYLVGDFAPPVYTQLEKPNVCAASWGGKDDWDYFNERCQRFVYDEMIRIKYGRPLYRDMAQIDGKTLGLILEDLDAIEADTPMLGATAAHVYQAVAPAVHDYLAVWEAMGKQRKAMHARYKKTLGKRGVLRKGNATRDMADLYYDLHEDMPEVKGLHNSDYVHTIIGFWMRRIDDGTANELVKFMQRSEKKFGRP